MTTATTRCLSCGAAVLSVASATSEKTMILDLKPEKRVVLGRKVIEPPGQEEWRDALVLNLPERIDGLPIHKFARVVDVYTDHHATCPDAAGWKGRKRKAPA
jgi:hypothetical protein